MKENDRTLILEVAQQKDAATVSYASESLEVANISAIDVQNICEKYNLQSPSESLSGVVDNGTINIHRETLGQFKSKMKSLSVIPHVGIGSLKLGMNPKQILDALYQIRSELSLPDNREIQIAKDKEDDGFSLRYQDCSFFFMVRYRDNRAVEIAVDHELREHAIIMLYDMDVFQILAEQLITSLKQFSFCSYDMEDEQLSTNYEFNDIGIRLWREEPFHPKLLSDESYFKEMELIIDEMYRYLYFEVIAVK